MRNVYEMTAEELSQDVIVAARLFVRDIGNREHLRISDLRGSYKTLKWLLDLYRERTDYRAALYHCSFPLECNERFTCERRNCNADVCSNGYAYRMS